VTTPSGEGVLAAPPVPGRPPATRRRPPWGRRVGAFLLWATVQGLFLAPASLAPYRPLIPPLLGALVNVGIAAAFVWWFVRRPIARGERRRLATLRIRPAGAAWPWVGAAVVAIMGLTPSGLLVSARLLRVPPDRSTILEDYAKLAGGTVALLVLVAVIAPLLEEFLFRGWIQRSLERSFVRRAPDRERGAWRAILVTSVAFAAVHADAFGFPLRFSLAVASGWAAWSTRSIWPSVVLHGAYNAWAMALGGILPVRTARDLVALARSDAVFWPAVAGVVVSTAALVWAMRGVSRAARAERAARAGRAAPD
jgi:hypothetical protein